jgi:hypothetical protein
MHSFYTPKGQGSGNRGQGTEDREQGIGIRDQIFGCPTFAAGFAAKVGM